MSKEPITYVYEVEGVEVAISRRHVATAYARNGNVGNPTQYFVWDASVDGATVVSGAPLRSDAYEQARARILGIPYCNDPRRPGRARNVRNYLLVDREMAHNYRRRVRAAT